MTIKGAKVDDGFPLKSGTVGQAAWTKAQPRAAAEANYG
jgi:hypothetical protein